MSASAVATDVQPIDLGVLEPAIRLPARPVAVLGLARSGVALARFLVDQAPM